MYCDECKSRPATVHYESTINGVKTSRDLCPECSKKISMDFGSPISLSNFFSNFFLPVQEEKSEDKKCGVCGLSASEFRNNSLLGCQNCYLSLCDAVEPYIRQIQKGSKHFGRLPANRSDINKMPIPVFKPSDLDLLKDELDDAVKAENFEHAAIVRDKIKNLSGSETKEGDDDER